MPGWPRPGRRPVGAAVGAHVQAEHVEVRAPGHPAVDPRRREAVAAPVDEPADRDRLVLLPGPAAARGEHVAAALGVAVVVDALARVPVVHRLVVVPLRDRRHLGVERADVPVEQRVAVPAAELRQGLGDLRDLLGDDVVPHLAGVLVLRGRDLDVGVDRVAAVDEEVRPGLEHGAVRRQAVELLVDPPALAAGVAGPHERRGRRVDRGRGERDPLGDARGAVGGGERDVGVVLPSRAPARRAPPAPCGRCARRPRGRARVAQPPPVAGQPHRHPAVAGGAAPEHRRVGGHLTRPGARRSARRAAGAARATPGPRRRPRGPACHRSRHRRAGRSVSRAESSRSCRLSAASDRLPTRT